MKIIYMEPTLSLLAGINPIMVEELSKQGELKQTEIIRYLVIKIED